MVQSAGCKGVEGGPGNSKGLGEHLGEVDVAVSLP